MIDCHLHVWTADNSTPAKRAERADQLRAQAEAHGIDRIALIHERGDTVEECRENNRIVAKYVEEHPDIFYGWARANPKWDEAGVAEFRRAVEEDGLVGLKLYAQVLLDDSAVYPLAEAAIDMDVPIISHVAHLPERTDAKPYESNTRNVRGLAERYPELTLISAHIGGGGYWERRIKNVADLDNVYLDTSGSVTDTDMLEMAAEYLGTDRLVFGTDTWMIPGVGKLDGTDLTPEQKADIAYNFEDLLHDGVTNRLSDAERERGWDRARERFAAVAQSRSETIVDANGFVGEWPFRDVDADSDEVVALMDRKGVDRALVSAAEGAFYRNPQAANRKLASEIRGHEDRLLPVATIDPTYPTWREDLAECLDDLGMQAVKLLPLYHDYPIDDPTVIDLLDSCADRDVPVIFCATVEDQRQRHPRVEIRDVDSLGSGKHFSGDHADALVDVLRRSPEVDVIVANGWTHAEHIHRSVSNVTAEGVRLDNAVRSGETLFVIDDLFVYFRHQGADVAGSIGTANLVCGPRLPFRLFEAHYANVTHLPVDEAAKDEVRSENVLSLLAIDEEGASD